MASRGRADRSFLVLANLPSSWRTGPRRVAGSLVAGARAGLVRRGSDRWRYRVVLTAPTWSISVRPASRRRRWHCFACSTLADGCERCPVGGSVMRLGELAVCGGITALTPLDLASTYDRATQVDQSFVRGAGRAHEPALSFVPIGSLVLTNLGTSERASGDHGTGSWSCAMSGQSLNVGNRVTHDHTNGEDA